MTNCMIDLDQLFVYVNFAKSHGSIVRGQVTNMRGRLNGIVSSNAMMGRTKDSINRLITIQQIPLLQGLENVYWKMFVKSNQAINEFMSAMSENEENAIFNHDSLVELESAIGQANGDVLDLNVEYQSIYSSIADDISLSMPSTGAYESNYEQARTSLRNTRECLEEFNFDYDEIRELMSEIEIYVGMLEGAGNLHINSAARANLYEGSDFAQRMSEMHEEFAAIEQAKIDRMVASWEGMHYTDIANSLPEPMSQAEWDALMEFIGGMCEEVQISFWESALGFSLEHIEGIWNYATETHNLALKSLKVFTDMGLTYLDILNTHNRFLQNRTWGNNIPDSARTNMRWDRFFKGLKRALPWISFGVGTIVDILRGDSPGQAIAYNGTVTVILVVAGATFLKAAPIGLAIGAGIGIAYVFKLLNDYTVVGDIINWGGDIIDAGISYLGTSFDNIVSLGSDIWHSDSWGDVGEAFTTFADNTVDNIVNLGSDIWSATTNLVDNVGQAISDFGEMINPFNWNWGW